MAQVKNGSVEGGARSSADSTASPTGPLDYALIEGVFLGGLGAVAALTTLRERQGAPPIPNEELPVLAVATFALAHVLAKERISTWVREPFVIEGDDHKPVEPKGTGLRRAVGELLTCARCLGAWSALGLVGLRTASPSAGRVTARVLALAGMNDALQSGFRLLVERTNVEIESSERAKS